MMVLLLGGGGGGGGGGGRTVSFPPKNDPCYLLAHATFLGCIY